MTVTPVDMFAQPIQLGDGRQLAAFHVRSDADVHADHWEVHTEGDELVSCLDGGLRLYLRGEREGDDEVVTLTPGTAVVVPRGRWHRIELDEPSDIMAITLRRGTRVEKRTA
jgi:mannose-6-phosphate isomerase-like protein (cupin superfamily)